jgi:hypothetical protein
MITDLSHPSGSALRERMIEDMTVSGFTEDTRRDYIRCVKTFAAFIGRSPDAATPEDLRRFQLHQTQAGMRPPGINSAVSALLGVPVAAALPLFMGLPSIRERLAPPDRRILG